MLLAQRILPGLIHLARHAAEQEVPALSERRHQGHGTHTAALLCGEKHPGIPRMHRETQHLPPHLSDAERTARRTGVAGRLIRGTDRAQVGEERALGEPAMIVDVEGYEGPLDLLLALARQQKVDLHKISILALADQYLLFIEEARKIRLELAADYLVMAAWLAFLKSRLLLPEPPAQEGPSAEEMATALANRLRRLEAIREAANRLMNRPQFQRDIFPRGNPESIAEINAPLKSASDSYRTTSTAARRSLMASFPTM